jgi:hypothetical protein
MSVSWAMALFSSQESGADMAYNDWPPLSVRDWGSVLAQRDPDWGREEEDFDGISGAHESRRIHELRGVIVGQVAEIENLLLHISAQIIRRSNLAEIRNRRAHGPAGVVLAHVKKQLGILGLENEFEAHLEAIRTAITDRNAIVHAVVNVGFSYVQFNDSRDCVLIILRDNDDDKWQKCLEETAELDPWDRDEMIPWDISEIDLERQLARAYKALDRCLDVWVRVNDILPDRPA